jgi:hypothetical protein
MEATKLGLMAEAIKQLHPDQQHKMESLNRPTKRRRLRILHGANSRPFARVPSGKPTGTTPHFKLWMADLNLKRVLQLTKLAKLADFHPDDATGSAYALLFGSGFKTVWDLTQSNKRDLLAVKGFGPAKLALVKADLAARQVQVNW